MAMAQTARQPTPVSPSPSPELEPAPQTNADVAPGQGFLAGDQARKGGCVAPSASNAIFSSASSYVGGVGSAAGQVPFHEVLQLGKEEPGELYRQHVEDCTLNVIDSLYQLAVCAADVQPGREGIIGNKINDTITHLASLSSISTSNPDVLPHVPQEVLEAVDEGRNPDALSKNRMARLVSDNQQLAGQRWALEEYRQLLSKSVSDIFSELAPSLEELEQSHRSQRTRPQGDDRQPDAPLLRECSLQRQQDQQPLQNFSGSNADEDDVAMPPPPPPKSLPAAAAPSPGNL